MKANLRNRRRFALVAAACLAAPHLSNAATSSWTFTGSGNWTTALNWLGGVPGAGTAVVIQHSDVNNRTITYNYTGASIQFAGVILDNTSVGSTIFSQSANTFNSSTVTFANTGRSYLNFSGGTMNVAGTLQFGSTTVSRAVGTITAGVINAGSLILGESGQATLTQSGGTLSGADFTLGHATAGRGTFNFSAGVASFSDSTVVGDAGAATLNQSGGSFVISGGLLLGNATSGAAGTYNLQAGSLESALEFIGESGRGNFIQTGGRNSGTALIDIGDGSLALGTYTLSGTGSVLAGAIIVGDEGNGTFIQNGGTVTVHIPFTPTDFILGSNATGDGTYLLNGGTILADQLEVGLGGSGTFIQTGGFVNLSSSDGVIVIGGSGTLSSQYFLGGTGSVSAPRGIFVGTNNARGVLSITAGTMTTSTSLSIGGAPGGIVNLNGGMLSIGSLSIADGGAFNWTSGTLQFLDSVDLSASAGGFYSAVAIGPLQTLIVNNTASGDGSIPIILGGGIFQAGSLTNGSLFDFDSGTFRLTGASLTVGTAGLFGNTVQLNSNQHIEITGGALTIDPGALLYLTGGSALDSVGINNNGQIQLTSPTAQLGSATLTNNGLVNGSGRITSPLNNFFGGTVRAVGSDWLRFTAANNTNSGQINLLGGAGIEFTGALTNTASGIISGQGNFYATGGLGNSGNVALSTSLSNIFGDITNNTGGRITISGQANVTFWDDVTNTASASFKVSPGSSATFFGTFSGAGITGGGTTNFEGDLSPGFSPAAISIDGNVALGSQSHLRIELGGHNRGSQYDAVNVTGGVSLDGKLTVLTLNGFVPLPGDSFDVLTFGSRTGDLAIDNQTGFAGLSFANTYTANDLTLTASALAGDANLDGKVDITDLYLLATNFNIAGNWLAGDFTGNGLINAADLGLLAGNWQTGAVGASLDAALTSLGLPVQSVPEPAISALSLSAVFLTMSRRRRASGTRDPRRFQAQSDVKAPSRRRSR